MNLRMLSVCCALIAWMACSDEVSSPAARDAGGGDYPDAAAVDSGQSGDGDDDGGGVAIDSGTPEPECADLDQDGVSGTCGEWAQRGGRSDGQDCDDLDPSIHPGATERCNGWDDDCDGNVDEGTERACGFACEAQGAGCDEPAQLVVGADHACVLTAGGSVWCWGSNASGQMANHQTTFEPAPARITAAEGASLLDTSGSLTCAVVESRVICWGREIFQPYVAFERSNVVELAVGDQIVCVRIEDGLGSVECHDGYDRYQGLVPVEAAVDLDQAIEIDAYDDFACARRENGSVHCWTSNSTPRRVVASGATTVTVGPGRSCATTDEPALRCWSRTGGSQIIAGMASARHVALGSAAECVASASGNVACMKGSVPSLGQFSSFGLGRDHGCALRENGAVSCWGSRASGAIGDGKLTSRAERPVTVLPAAARVTGDDLLFQAGACNNREDVAALTTGSYGGGARDAQEWADECVRSCTGTLDSDECVLSCTNDVGLSPACAACFIQHARCSGAACYAARSACAGLDIDFIRHDTTPPAEFCVFHPGACANGAASGEPCTISSNAADAADFGCASGACGTPPMGKGGEQVCLAASGGTCRGWSIHCTCAIDPNDDNDYFAFGTCSDGCGPGLRQTEYKGTDVAHCVEDCGSDQLCSADDRCVRLDDGSGRYCQ